MISEIMYQPAANEDADYLEILNVSDQGVTLFDSGSNTAWQFTSGIGIRIPLPNSPWLSLPENGSFSRKTSPAFNNEFGRACRDAIIGMDYREIVQQR